MSVMTGCTEKDNASAELTSDSAAETTAVTDGTEITTAVTAVVEAENIQEREPVFYESSVIKSVTADKAKGRLVETATSFSVVTANDMEASDLQNIIFITPNVNFKVDKISNSNFKLELAEPLPENSMTVISQKDDDGEAVYKWAFQTEGRFTATEFYPADESSYVSLDSGIEITFTSPVNAEGAENYFEITPSVSGKFQTHRSTLYFIPSEKFERNTRYSVKLKKEFTSADGIALDKDISFSFVTNDGDRTTYFYASNGISETFLEGDTAVVEVYCSKGMLNKDYDLKLYRYGSADDYRKAMQGFIDSGETSEKYEFSKEGLEEIYSDTQKLMQGNDNWGPSFIMLPDNLEEGYYFAEITTTAGKDTYRIRRHIQVNPISVYSAYIGGKTQFFINDTETGNAADGAEITLATADGTYSAKTDAQGIAMLEVPTEKSGTGILEIKWGSSLYCDFYDYYISGQPSLDDLYFSYVYTDRAIYNRDDKINVWGVIRPRKKGIAMPDDVSLTLGYDGLQFPLEINSDGTFSSAIDFTDLSSSWGAPVTLMSGDKTLSYTYVQIKDHIKPTYEFETDVPVYVMYPQETPFKVSVQANLFDGTAADGLTFDVEGNEIVTDESGYAEAEITFRDVTEFMPQMEYVDFRLAGVENSYTEEYARTLAFYRDIMVEESYDEKTHKLELTASKITPERITDPDDRWEDDFNDKIRGESTDITAEIEVIRIWSEKIENGTYYDFLQKKNITKYKYEHHEETVMTKSVTTENGKCVIDIPEDEGRYKVIINWNDSAGRPTEEWFYVYNYENDYNHDESQKWFSFSTDKTSFKENEAINFTLENNYNRYDGEGRVLLQLHGTGFDDYAVYEGTSFSHVMTAECIPNVTAIGAYFDGRHVYPVHQDYYYGLEFNPEEREIVLDIASDKQKYAPGEKASVTVTAKDKNGNIMPGVSLVLSVADEASFAVAEQHADPLGELYKGIYSGYAVQYYSYIEHSLDRGTAGEMGGGGDDVTVRRNFKDTASFLTAVTDKDGRAEFSFDLPDNITEWRATAVAVYEKESDFVYAGSAKHSLVVTQPLFIELIMLDEIVEGDDLAVSAHCFGEKSGTEKITVTLTGNGVNLEKSALAGRTVNFGKVKKGEYTVRFKAESNENSDIVERKITVCDSFLETNISAEANLADGIDIEPKSWPMCIVFRDAEHMLYTDTLWKLTHRAGERLDMRIASYFAQKEFGFITEEEYVSAFEGITSTGLAQLMLNSQGSIALTAKICAAAPELVNKSTVSKKMYDVINTDSSTPTQVSSAYLALAALGEPVMTEIRDVLESSEFSSTFSIDKFSVEDGLRMTAALAFLGDFDTAIEFYNRFTSEMSVSINADGEETARLKSVELTQTAIMSAALLRLPEADSIARYLVETKQVYDSFALELMVYLNNYTTKSDGDAVFTYTRNGKPETVTLDRHFGTHITFTEKQFEEADFKVQSGEILAYATYKGHPSQNITSPTVTVKKTVSGDFTPGGLVTVTIKVSGGADKHYTINDVIPSCARFDGSDNYANVNGQLVTVYTDNYGTAKYSFRISTAGEYVLESAVASDYENNWGMSERTVIKVSNDGTDA